MHRRLFSKPLNNLHMVFMLLNKRLSANSLAVFLLFVVSTLIFGCSSTKEAEMLHQINKLLEKNSQLEAELAEENAVTGNLQMKLVEKQMEIDRIIFTQEHLTQEIAQTKARIPAPNSKVEVVTYLAEVETEVNEAKEIASEREQIIFARVNRLIAESKVEFELGHYDAAVSLASQAVELTRAIKIKQALDRRKAEGRYAEFSLPLYLHLAKRSNIRKKPNIRGKILVTLPPRTPVTAIGYQGDWIKVKIENGEEGWVYYTLLVVPETSLRFHKPVK